MLPHQFCAFVEGLFEPMHAEFERTPKKGDKNGMKARPSENSIATTGTTNSSLSEVDEYALSYDAEGQAPLLDGVNSPVPGYKGFSDNNTLTFAPKKNTSKIHWYVYAETSYAIYQFVWFLLFLKEGFYGACLMAIYQALCVSFLLMFYGDDRDADIFSFITCQRSTEENY
jgi:hypothetical protein